MRIEKTLKILKNKEKSTFFIAEMQIAIDAGFDNPDPAVQEVFMGKLNPVIRKVNRMW